MLHYIKKKKTHLWIRIKPNLVLREGLWGRGREGWQGPGWQDSWNLLDYMVEEWPHVCIFRFHCSSWNGVEWHACSVVSVTLWTVARQAPLSMEFPRQGYWHVLPFPSPEDLPDPAFLVLAGRFFTTLPWNGVGRVMSVGAGKCFTSLAYAFLLCKSQ